MVMKRLAILEEEKNAADKILEEEYQRRLDNEGKYYLEKRRVLEEAIADIQEDVYGGMVGRTGIGEEGEREEAHRDGGDVPETPQTIGEFSSHLRECPSSNVLQLKSPRLFRSRCSATRQGGALGYRSEWMALKWNCGTSVQSCETHSQMGGKMR